MKIYILSTKTITAIALIHMLVISPYVYAAQPAESSDDTYVFADDDLKDNVNIQTSLLRQQRQLDEAARSNPRDILASVIRAALYNRCPSIDDLEQAIAEHKEHYEQRDVDYYVQHHGELEDAASYIKDDYAGPNISPQQTFQNAHFLYRQSPDLKRALHNLIITNNAITIKEAVLLQIALKRFGLENAGQPLIFYSLKIDNPNPNIIALFIRAKLYNSHVIMTMREQFLTYDAFTRKSCMAPMPPQELFERAAFLYVNDRAIEQALKKVIFCNNDGLTQKDADLIFKVLKKCNL